MIVALRGRAIVSRESEEGGSQLSVIGFQFSVLWSDFRLPFSTRQPVNPQHANSFPLQRLSSYPLIRFNASTLQPVNPQHANSFPLLHIYALTLILLPPYPLTRFSAQRIYALTLFLSG